MVRPKLSSVIQPLYDIDVVGMRLLTKYMNEEEIEEPNVILPHRIEYREYNQRLVVKNNLLLIVTISTHIN